MNRQTLPLNEIKVGERFRKDYGDITGLADSIRDRGIICPLVIDQNKTLIDGGRRYHACVKLGLTVVDVVYRETLTEDELHELELEANIQRKEMTWTERCIGVYEIHKMRQRRGATEGWSWGQRETGAMFDMQLGTVNYTLRVAKLLISELTLPDDQRRFHKYNNAAEAWRLGVVQDEKDRVEAELARRARDAANKGSSETEAKQLIQYVETLAAPVALAAERERYAANPLNVVPFDTYWEEKQRLASEAADTVFLSNRIIQGDCIAYMNDEAQLGRFDHIITDPPYAIDMGNLEQENQGMTGIGRVEEQHDVERNRDLLSRFFPAAWRCTKENAFVAVFCDIMVWQHLYDLAVAAGFAVQRWPVIWRKTHMCMNSANQYNTTKDFELIMLCRKPKTTLVRGLNTSIIEASNEAAKAATSHPFAKPFEITRLLANSLSIEGQLILEPFAGGGSIAIELLRAKRNVIAVELETHWFNGLLENVKREYYLKLNPKFVFK